MARLTGNETPELVVPTRERCTVDAEHRDTVAPRVHHEEEPVVLAVEKERVL